MGFKICVIGCGDMAINGHGPSYKKYAMLHPDVVLAGCCDLDEQRAARFKNQFGFERYYTDVTTMLDREKPDAVCLIVPPQQTETLSLQIMKKGYPLLLEKPPGLDKEQTLCMIECANKYGVPNQVAFNRRYTPVVSGLKHLLKQILQLEGIQNIHYDVFRVGRKENDFAITAIHGIDTVKHIADSDYRYIRFDYQEFPQLGPGVANIYMHCEFGSGATAHINLCPVSGTVIERATVNAYNHTFFVHIPWGSMDASGRLLHIFKDQIQLDITGSELSASDDMFLLNGFYEENAAFFDNLRAGIKPAGDIASGLQSVEIADSIRKRKREYLS
jgi:myo-inositol 2-dehydrogenase/D-chiro-inositol 1-dehydrogenase